MPKDYLTLKLIKLFIAIAICVVLVFLNPKNIFNPVRGVFLRATYPFQKIAYVTSGKISNAFALLSSISDFKSENEKLTKENNVLWAKISNLQDQKRENENLRNQLELAPRDRYRLEASLIIGQDPNNQGSWLMIDKGKSKGIEVDMPVIVYDGILIGKISEVYENSSKIILLTDSSSAVNVINSETGAKGILSGEYNLGLVMEMVEQTDVLKIEDNVVTSGLGGIMPKGFLIGKINQVYNTQDKLFQQAIIIPKVKYSDLDIVFVVKGII